MPQLPTSVHRPGATVIVVDTGRALATIVADQSDQILSAATDLLVSTVHAATGVTVPITSSMSQEAAGTIIALRTISDCDPPGLRGPLGHLGDEGYVITVDPQSVTILANSTWGIHYGVLQFLHTHVGARWLLPGAIGEHVPQVRTVSIQCGVSSGEPAFRSRRLTPLGREAMSDSAANHWAMANGLRLRVTEFDHNLWRVFDPAIYGDARRPDTYSPEFYPILNGERYIPPVGRIRGWNPRFSERGTIETATKAACDYFTENPEADSFSLSANDTGGYSEDDYDSRFLDRRGVYSLSEAYYRWVNQVAERVSQRFPDKTLGVFAYNQTLDPPSFRLHPQVLPFICLDRFGWIEPAVRDAHQRIETAWRQVSDRIAWYDYCYGTSFVIPRVNMRAAADAYRYAQRTGVESVEIELFPDWGEAPRNWMLAQLLAHPDDDPDRLLADWCNAAVGPAAAQLLIDYFNHWENLWTTRIPGTRWFRSADGLPYYPFSNPGYMPIVGPDDLHHLRQLLEDTRTRTATPIHRARLAPILQGFAYYEASVQCYPREFPAPSTSAAAQHMLDHVTQHLDHSLDAAIRRYALHSELSHDPLMRRSFDPHQAGLGMNWSGWPGDTAWKLGEFLATNPDTALQDTITTLATNSVSENLQRFANMVLAIARSEAINLCANNDFASTSVEPWSIRPSDPPREHWKVEHTAHCSGLHLAGGFHFCHISQRTPLRGLAFRLSTTYFVPNGHGRLGSISMFVDLYDNDDTHLVQFRSESFLLADSEARWATITLAEIPPPGAASIEITCSVKSLALQSDIHIRSISLHAIDPTVTTES